MNSSTTAAQSDRLLGLLTTRQYLFPAEPLTEAVLRAFGNEGVPNHLGEHAIEAEELRGDVAVGRLSRKDICRLARRVEASWQSAKRAQQPSSLVA